MPDDATADPHAAPAAAASPTGTNPHRAQEWDATTYHRVSVPHVDWGQSVLARLPLRGDETVLDAGCGSGRLTARLLERLPDGQVIAVDASANMLHAAADHLAPRFGDRVTFRQADLQRLTLAQPVDAIFSTATFHWIRDHERLFRHLYAALRPGGRLVAQCGGGPNLDRLLTRVARLMAAPDLAPSFAGWDGPWEFTSAETAADRLRAAGFDGVVTGIEAKPTVMADAAAYREFLTTVILHSHLERISGEAARDAFADALTEQARADDPPFLLDYWRLNLKAQRPAAERRERT